MLGHLGAVRRKLKTAGLRKTSVLAARRGYDTIFRGKLLLFRADLTDFATDRAPSAGGDRVETRRSIGELTALERTVFSGYGGEGLLTLWEKRFEQGHRLFVLYRGVDVAGASWLYEGGQGEFFTVSLGPGEAFIVAVFVLDPFRGKGLGTRVLELILQRMKEDGYQRAFISTKEWNHFQKAVRKAGFEYVGKIREMKMLGKVIQVWSDCGGREFP